jgi:pSer/pThr/pTyr-binding forkhead associated (FHA) protein
MNLYEGTDEKIIFRKIIDLINKEENDEVVVEKVLVEEKIAEKKFTNVFNGFFKILKKVSKVNFHSNKAMKKVEKKEENSSTVILKSIKKGYFLVSKSEENENIAIKDYNILIGRSKNNVDAFIDNISVGKIHAEVINDGGQYYIKDMNSLNGTFINDKKIPSFKMKEINVGDVVRFADAEYLFKLR